MIITRDWITKDILVYQHNQKTLELDKVFNYKQFCEMIDFWKLILIDKYNAKPGEQCLIDFSDLNVYYSSAIFAAAELGLILVVDFPHCYNEDDLNSYRVNMHGPIDYIITQHHKYDASDSGYNEWDCKRNAYIGKQVIFQEDLYDYKVQNTELFKTITDTIWATSESTLIHSASSGTTGAPSKIVNSHNKVYAMAERMGRLLGFAQEDRVLHIRNIHHGAGMAYHFLPSFHIVKEHYTYVPANYNDLTDLIKFVEDNKITFLFLYLQQLMMNYLRATPKFDRHVKITTLFHITEEAVQLVKDKNIQFIRSLFGDTTIGQGFFLKYVDKFTDLFTYDVSNQGTKLDDFFGIAVLDGKLHIEIPSLGETWKTSNDRFDVINNEYYFRGRANQYRINYEWVQQADVEREVREHFSDDANVVFDPEHERIYLAVWNKNDLAYSKVLEYFIANYKNVSISYVMNDQNKEEFFNSRKIDNNKIREYCRKQL